MDENTVPITVVVLMSLLLRWSVTLNPYSGANNPPMYGDYEAQRHWMEITHQLPVNQWYVQTEQNDLQYWGLDYPPLTAYHSKLCGYIANLINPDWVALNTSRGHESYQHKLFMRYSVLFVDVMIYMPAIILFVKETCAKLSSFSQATGLLLVLSYPGLILIDHGHFQYNCVSLGFTMMAMYYISKDRHCKGSLFFVLALNYKQMSLYHSFPFFFYLLGIVNRKANILSKISKLLAIGLTVLITFILCWFPFVQSFDDSLNVMKRLFPFNRGLFEDKVANFWCSLSVFVKIKNIFTQDQIVKLCTSSTLLACMPSCLDLLVFPTKKKFLYSLVNCSLSFFLFSYQVHEKSILIAALPVCALLFDAPLASTWFLIISTFSMYPLLVRDGQAHSYFCLLVIFLVISCNTVLDFKNYSKWIKNIFIISLLGAMIIHISFALVKPPSKFPDLFPLLFAVYSCAHFGLFYLYFLYSQFKCSKDDVAIDRLFYKLGNNCKRE